MGCCKNDWLGKNTWTSGKLWVCPPFAETKKYLVLNVKIRDSLVIVTNKRKEIFEPGNGEQVLTTEHIQIVSSPLVPHCLQKSNDSKTLRLLIILSDPYDTDPAGRNAGGVGGIRVSTRRPIMPMSKPQQGYGPCLLPAPEHMINEGSNPVVVRSEETTLTPAFLPLPPNMSQQWQITAGVTSSHCRKLSSHSWWPRPRLQHQRINLHPQRIYKTCKVTKKQ